MNQSILIKYEIIKINGADHERSYVFTHPFAAPSNEVFDALEQFKQTIEMRVVELQNVQAAQSLQQSIDSESNNGN